MGSGGVVFEDFDAYFNQDNKDAGPEDEGGLRCELTTFESRYNSVELRPQGAHSLELATSSLFGLRYFILYGTSTLFYIPSSRAQHVYN